MMLWLLLIACAHVPAWERGTLQSRPMQEVLCPLEAGFDAHVDETREHVRGASGAGGASCGCS